MSLRKNIEISGEGFMNTPSGQVSLGNQQFTFSAYCKIVNINADKQSANVLLECSDENYKMIKQYTVPLSVDSGSANFIKQAYLHLKTLPEWADATDC